MTNMTTALAAKSVWFNSAFHRDSFLEALAVFLGKMPDCQPIDTVERISAKALIYPPGVNVGRFVVGHGCSLGCLQNVK